MGKFLTLAGKAVLFGGGLFVLWLFAIWPPPVWYRTHWPAETAFQRMRRAQGSGQMQVTSADTSKRFGLLSDAEDGPRPLEPHPVVLRLYFPIALSEIDPQVAEAVIAGEDQRFREHGGIDWVNLRRALGYPRDRFAWGAARDRSDLVRALGRAYERRDALRGASTLTQQLAKNLYLSPSRNPLRKVKEAVTAYRLESALGKDRILELYLNVAEMGPEIWGVRAASAYYFRHYVGDLTLTEATSLAAMLPFPLRSNPAFRPARMEHRQRLIARLLRGEEVEVPPVAEDEAMPLPVESLPPVPVDTLALPTDTLPGAPPDTTGAPLPESLPAPPDTVPIIPTGP